MKAQLRYRMNSLVSIVLAVCCCLSMELAAQPLSPDSTASPDKITHKLIVRLRSTISASQAKELLSSVSQSGKRSEDSARGATQARFFRQERRWRGRTAFGGDKSARATAMPSDSPRSRISRTAILEYNSEAAMNAALQELHSNPLVESASVDRKIIELQAIPNDPYSANTLTRQWGIYALNLPNAWDLTQGHASLGSIDNAVVAGHPDLIQNFRPHLSRNVGVDAELNAVPGYDNLLGPYANHGTHTSGIMVAKGDNLEGVAGTCWNCSLTFASFGGGGNFNISTLATGYLYLMETGVQVVNGSFATQPGFNRTCPSADTGTQLVCDLMEIYTQEREGLIVAASGNGSMDLSPDIINLSVGLTDMPWPANASATIAVGASDSVGNRVVFSNYGPALDVVAPGISILSTSETLPFQPLFCEYTVGDEGDDDYGLCAGTSMSAPFVTGLLGLMRSADPLLTRAQLTSTLLSSGDRATSPTSDEGHGVPDAFEAVSDILGEVNGATIDNRLTPLFSFYSTTGQNSFFTTSAQMAAPALDGTFRPRPREFTSWGHCIPAGSSCWGEHIVSYLPYGSSISHYSRFPPLGGLVLGGSFPPLAEVFVFTTQNNPIQPSQPLVPLYRLSYVGANGANTENVDHVYTTEQAGIALYASVGYKLDAVEGYIFDDNYAQPADTEKLYRYYHPGRDDHKLFPESKLAAMTAQGYQLPSSSVSPWIGYVYTNTDTDGDELIDGFELAIGTCPNDSDTDNDGINDGDEVLQFPRTDPIGVVVACTTTPPPPPGC